ncbi:transposase [Rhodanobacter sp. B05]|uniref:transposase n=1 Tax=Rhodanobacter sp. B05 TaxID=1945859 RepID=UPI0009879D8A|nr:transposase [Rhodanobacter sp. B05]OOG54110.1 transposase [Rhodanobacter sp. B05]
MPRRSRLELPGTPLHVIQRGVNRCANFVDDVDRRHYYDLLCDAADAHDIAIHAYVFMGNHIHLLLTSTQPDALSQAMRNTGQCYVQAFNRRHGRSGTLWQGRFKSCLVDTERYVMTVYRYIELNPVRAAMAERPEQHRWSSVHANLGLLKDRLVTPHSIYLELDHDAVVRAAAYRTWLHDGVSDDDPQRIRAHLQQERALGDTKFQTMVEKALGRPVAVRPRGRPISPPSQPPHD